MSTDPSIIDSRGSSWRNWVIENINRGCTSFPDSGLDFSPSVGGAVFFNSVDSNGLPDRSTLHAATPVVRGVKIVVVYWQREKAFLAKKKNTPTTGFIG